MGVLQAYLSVNHIECIAHRDRKSESGSLELGLQIVISCIWVQGIEPGSML